MSFSIDERVAYVYMGHAKLKDGGKFPEEELKVSFATITGRYEEPARGKFAKVTQSATRKNPFYKLTNISTGKNTVLPHYVVLRPMTGEEQDQWNFPGDLKSSTSGSSKRSSNDSEDDIEVVVEEKKKKGGEPAPKKSKTGNK